MTNTCATLEPGVGGCCCNTNGCIDPTKSPAKSPANRLQCYVGLYAVNANINVGAEVYCNGKCASMTGRINGDDVTTFQCVSTSICRSLELDDACMRLPGDRIVNTCATIEPGVGGCCCNTDSCIFPPSRYPGPPLQCYVGLYAPDAGVNVGSERHKMPINRKEYARFLRQYGKIFICEAKVLEFITPAIVFPEIKQSPHAAATAAIVATSETTLMYVDGCEEYI
ncbi:ET module [Necator americanus]|uniref:ET module n=1 Tax=Necator americanus TaxID=51031 RepID=W2T0V8_NECAM|nr:ET module [Necator americanus]ETN75533.1 ET module [Necator americanus]